MHYVAKVEDVPVELPSGYEGHADGYGRAALVGAPAGAVHSGFTLACLEAGGRVDRHVHSYEEGFFVLEGSVVVELDGRAYELREGDYGVFLIAVPHGMHSAEGARILEMTSPQPRIAPRDTFFVGGEVPEQAPRPEFGDPRTRHIGHFDESQLPPASELQMDGYSGGAIAGVQYKMLVDRVLGSAHLTMFIVQFQPGGGGNVHDHSFEECYFMLDGEVEGILDGTTYQLGPGDVVWSGVGGTHGFFQQGDKPVRWLETQAPHPPSRDAFRFAAEWEVLERRLA